MQCWLSNNQGLYAMRQSAMFEIFHVIATNNDLIANHSEFDYAKRINGHWSFLISGFWVCCFVEKFSTCYKSTEHGVLWKLQMYKQLKK